MGPHDASLSHQIVSGASNEAIRFSDATGSATVSKNVTCSGRIVLQFHREVVQTCFLVVESATTANVELSAFAWRLRDSDDVG